MSNNKRLFWLVSIGLVTAKLLAKFGAPFFKLLKGLKFAKAGLTVASLGAYAYLWSWKFALVFMGGLFFHELGHVWAMKREGVPHRGINFIPFLGAVIVPEKDFPSRKAEAFIGIMGPVWGGALAVTTYVAYRYFNEPLLAALAGWMAMLNLFNLLPVSPLDGGRVVKSIVFSIHSGIGLAVMIIVFGALFALAIASGLALIWVIMVPAVVEILMEFEEARVSEVRAHLIRFFAEKIGVEPKAEAVVAFFERTREQAREQVADVNSWPLSVYDAESIRHLTAYKLVKLIDETLHDNILQRLYRYYGVSEDSSWESLGLWRRKCVLDARWALTRGIHYGEPGAIRRALCGETKPSMTALGVKIVAVAYLGLVGALLAVLYLTQHVEGASHAFEIFKS